jgi:NAD(P)-dependent dehydrogenase (short-subunit alcohol dehydrogenase family)
VAPGDRPALLRRFAEEVDSNRENLAQLEVSNAGHTIGNARWEAGNVRDVLHYYAAAPERLIGKQIPVPGGVNITFAEPLGVVGVIVPWNFPMPIAGWGFAPALAAGNTVVLKPAELTPLTALRLAELAREAGLPEDVFQVLPGKGSVVGQRFVEHPDERKVVFTGSTEVGKQIMAGCAAQVKRVTLELGGKNANIVFADADLEKAAATAPYGVFDNAGQDCCARSRILVQARVCDRFLELLEPAVKGIVVADPSAETTEMGPLISREHRDKVASYPGGPAQVAFRGSASRGAGFWFPPTVVLRAGAGTGRRRGIHRDQERLHQHRLTAPTMGPTRATTPGGESMSQRLNGRVAVITGGGSGIGLASARRLAAEGARIVIADVDTTSGKAAADEVGGEFIATDVTNGSQVEALFQAAVDRFGSLDIAFNNAGISPPEDDSILTTGLEAWQKVQQVNLTSVYLCCKYAIPHMRRQGKGSIINTASFVAIMGAATSQISYTASKGGVLAMSRELGVQFARDGVRVNALCPGPVNTPLLRELFAKDPERAARRLVHIPMGRFAEPEEIAGAVAFLASDDSSFITASQFLVDGGIAGAYVTPL